MTSRKLAASSSQDAQSIHESDNEREKLDGSKRKETRGNKEIRFETNENGKILKTQSEYYPTRASPILWWKKTKNENNSKESKPRYADYKKTHRKGVARAYKREVICPRCDLKVSSFSTDFVNCRRCGLEYTFPYSDRPFEREENPSSQSNGPEGSSSQSGSELLKRRQFLKMECLDCHANRIIYVYPGEVVQCVCNGPMVLMKYRNRKS